MVVDRISYFMFKAKYTTTIQTNRQAIEKTIIPIAVGSSIFQRIKKTFVAGLGNPQVVFVGGIFKAFRQNTISV